MKKFALLIGFISLHMLLFGQSNCDTLLCAQYADSNSYKILNNPGEEGSEVISANNNFAEMTCDILCEIEANRKKYHDVIIYRDGMEILIYAKEPIIYESIKEEE